MSKDKISEKAGSSNGLYTLLSAVPFTYEWWMEVGKKAYCKAENLAWCSYYWEVANYCKSRAEDCDFKKHSR